MIDISVILINYNSENYTINCLKSLFSHTSKKINCEFIIVDNASKKYSYFKVKEFVDSIIHNHNIKLVRSNINTGFGGGNMIGVQHASGKYFAFINNDTYLENDCLMILKLFMDSHPNVGVCGPQAFSEGKTKIKPTIDHFASVSREILGRKFLEKINPSKYPKRKILYNSPQKGQYVAGSFMFFRSNDFNAVGGFDTNIFLFHEETDICKRLLNINKLAYLVPEGIFIHYHGASTPKSVKYKIELKISLLYVVRKHYGLISFYVLLTFLQIKYFFSSIVKPKYRKLFYILLLQAPLSKSLKQQQKIESIF
ncbi:glycosyltransferase family 2 protein [Aureisphaera sp. CAU 1614]|uniref:Glycosyltransferase family 2 protein n=1 Tax=Halomarinibacterium sedimenti TaxID=2857106 RepID=A0A9X1FPF9_9FLAO|nr:glycosyltransferase family 2 protein [Halomarinibacterium sedimenti]MBW2938365.1 glycosyltransferase family 2 protein [Halomarinibacterium sedimenti]